MNKKLCPPGIVRYPRGFIGGEKVNPDDVNDADLLPLLMTYRPFHPTMGRFKQGVFLREFTIVPEKGIVNGRPCILLREKDSQHGPKLEIASLWLDPSREYVIMRYSLAVRNKIVLQFDFERYVDQDGEWVPTGWKQVAMRQNGSLFYSETCKAHEHLTNVSINKGEFGLDFPLGTWVIDRRSSSSPGAATEYIIRDDGKHRPITDSDRGATYEQLLTTEPGMALRASRTWGTGRVWLFAALLLVGILLTGMIWRRISLRRAFLK